MTANAGWASGPARRSIACSRRVTGRSSTLVQPEDHQDRRDVEQQDVLEHVHHHQLLAERVDRRHERDEDRGETAQEQR